MCIYNLPLYKVWQNIESLKTYIKAEKSSKRHKQYKELNSVVICFAFQGKKYKRRGEKNLFSFGKKKKKEEEDSRSVWHLKTVWHHCRHQWKERIVWPFWFHLVVQNCSSLKASGGASPLEGLEVHDCDPADKKKTIQCSWVILLLLQLYRTEVHLCQKHKEP